MILSAAVFQPYGIEYFIDKKISNKPATTVTKRDSILGTNFISSHQKPQIQKFKKNLIPRVNPIFLE